MYSQMPDFDGHRLVTTRHDRASGLRAVIAIHDEFRGPALGGCRILDYATPDAAITDALRLARGMTYKNAIADIPYGGGKAVIIADPSRDKTPALLHAMGDFVESLGGRYVTSFDSGTTLDDVRTMGERTAFVAGTLPEAGNASGSTANGVYHCLRAAAELALDRADLAGVRVAIQGVGNVGERLAVLLAADGAHLVIADSDDARARRVAAATGASVVAVAEIVAADVDLFAPCALGAVLSRETIPRLLAKAIVGGANNQLATPADDDRLAAAGILYCPDYLANAGGIIDLHYQRTAWSAAAVDRHVRSLAGTFREIAARARVSASGTTAIADAVARARFGAA